MRNVLRISAFCVRIYYYWTGRQTEESWFDFLQWQEIFFLSKTSVLALGFTQSVIHCVRGGRQP